ncbi:hypothetical protein T03_4259 [Trichinella britovi]|uniref:Uncharacterized protein n=1 Tax=Trichinella britovi TaxID=45882 RepID=A0A0V1DF33_TRIBR|nr:hypothetical protein T03_4259 [Trichinella britovi]
MSILSVVKRSKFLKSSPPYADTVIGPNSQQWVGSQDEWLSHTLKEPIFDLEANELQNLKPLASQLAVCTCSFSKREAQFTFRIKQQFLLCIAQELVQRKAVILHFVLIKNYWKGIKKRPIIINFHRKIRYGKTKRAYHSHFSYNEQLSKGSVEDAE